MDSGVESDSDPYATHGFRMNEVSYEQVFQEIQADCWDDVAALGYRGEDRPIILAIRGSEAIWGEDIQIRPLVPLMPKRVAVIGVIPPAETVINIPPLILETLKPVSTDFCGYVSR